MCSVYSQLTWEAFSVKGFPEQGECKNSTFMAQVAKYTAEAKCGNQVGTDPQRINM